MKKIGSAKKWFRRETDYRCSGEEGIGIAKKGGGDIEREREREASRVTTRRTFPQGHWLEK